MYICLECGYRFQYPLHLKEKHNLANPPYETVCVCPRCKSTDFERQEIKYCRACGARLRDSESNYCSDACKNNAKKLWQKEMLRKKRLRDSDIFTIVRQIDNYNQIEGRKLSYGQYVAIMDGKTQKGGNKNEG